MHKAPEEIQDKTVLIVDDEKSISRLISIILQRQGFQKVLVASSGFEALDILGIDHPNMGENRAKLQDPQHVDLVLLDIMLPNINGFEVCKMIKSSLDRFLPVMLITGFNIEQHHARYIESGADDFLTKPISPKELSSRVNLHLTRAAKLGSDPNDTDRMSPVGVSAELLNLSYVGPYQIERSLAWSGSVAIYLANRDDQKVVVKVLTQQAMEYEDVVQRFNREAALMERFEHPNVIHLIDKGVHCGLPYYVMEYVDGTNLEVFCSENPKPGFGIVYKAAMSLASALEHIHDHGVVHRDVKLKNVFLTKQQDVKLGDFGIALSMGDIRLTQEGYAIGTPVYMAPEQFEGKNVTPSADIYSLGASLYHMITGFPPFTASNAMELLRKHLQEAPPPLTSRRPGIPKAWNDLLVKRCLAKKPVDRPADTTEVIRALEALQDQTF